MSELKGSSQPHVCFRACKSLAIIFYLEHVETKEITVKLLKIIGPLHDSVTWYGINYNVTQITQWENSYQSSPTFLCFESHTE